MISTPSHQPSYNAATEAEDAHPSCNACGFPVHPTAEGIEAFWRWFAGSKATDEHGLPLVMYHGTSYSSRDGYSDKPKEIDFDYDGPKFFTTSPFQASLYGCNDGATIVPVYLSVRRPYIVTEDDGSFAYFDGSEGGGVYDDTEYLKSEGYDGAVWRENGQPDVWVVFDAEQIKSSIGNDGTFHPGDKSLIGDRHPSSVVPDAADQRTESIRSAMNAPGAQGTASPLNHEFTAMPFASNPRAIAAGAGQHPRTNSRGVKIHATEEGTEAFWRWFSESKVADRLGRPLVLFHGTGKDFNRFDTSKAGSNWRATRYGFYFSTSTVEAAGHATRSAARNRTGGGATIMPVYLSIKNPLIVKAGSMGAVSHFDVYRDEILRKQREGGHDGIVVDDGIEQMVVALRPEQVKSATGNDGTFDPTDASLIGRRRVLQQSRRRVCASAEVLPGEECDPKDDRARLISAELNDRTQPAPVRERRNAQ